jgi:uncharacterized membrane protein YphA (DoxX/SURF4 family)
MRALIKGELPAPPISNLCGHHSSRRRGRQDSVEDAGSVRAPWQASSRNGGSSGIPPRDGAESAVKTGREKLGSFGSVFLRFALGLSFLSAVADRFGWWGASGQPNVDWGNFARFVEYTGKLNWFLPHAIIPALAVVATCAEILFGLLLLAGWQTRITALCSAILLMTFGLSMTLALGIKAPLNFSVFSAAGGSLLLATCTAFPFSVDELRRLRAR